MRSIGKVSARNYKAGQIILRWEYKGDIITVVDDDGKKYKAIWKNKIYLIKL